jgi:hypothetical protein
VLDQPHASVLAHRSTWEDATMVAVHNFGPEPQKVPVRLEGCGSGAVLEDLLTVGTTPVGDDGSVEVALDGYGYRWLRLVPEGSRRLP